MPLQQTLLVGGGCGERMSVPDELAYATEENEDAQEKIGRLH